MAAYISDGGKHVIVVNTLDRTTKAFGPFDEVNSLQFAADGRAFVSAKRGDKMFVVIDGMEQTPFDTVGAPVLSPDGTRHAYLATDRGVTRYVIDGVSGIELGAFTSPLTFSADSRRYGYSTSSGTGPTRYLIDGQIILGPSAGGVNSSVIFSQDARHFGYVVANEKNLLAYAIDGNVRPYNARVENLTFWSIESRFRFAYTSTSKKNKSMLLTDAKKKYPVLIPSDPIGLGWSTDGTRYAHLALRNARQPKSLMVVVNGVPITPAGHTALGPPRFSMKDSSIAHLARSTRSRDSLFIDSKRVYSVKGFAAGPVQPTEYGFMFLEKRGDEWRRIEIKPI